MPLSDEELAVLAEFLESLPGAMSLEMVDGFFSALICSPELDMPINYFPYVWGEDYEFETTDDLKRYTSMVVRHWNTIAKTIRTETEIDPLFLEHEGRQGIGNEWAEGFLLGMGLGGEGWADLVNDDKQGGVLVPIFSLGHEHDSDPELRPDPITDEKRELMLEAISVFVPKIYQYFEPYRRFENLTSTRIP